MLACLYDADMSTTTKHFSDKDGQVIELVGTLCEMPASKFRLKFPGVTGVRFGANFAVMLPRNAPSISLEHALPVTRSIRYKNRPSLHECSAKCMQGRCNGVCECRCGGKNHGIGRV